MSLRIACCISGYPTPKIIEHLSYLTKYKISIDFFMFFWDVVDDVIKIQIKKILPPKDIVFMKPINFSYDAIFKEPDKHESKNNALSMFYGISYVQQMRQQYERKIGRRYDVVIRFRYDIHLFSDLYALSKNIFQQLNLTNVVFPFDRHHIGICDQIWFGKSVIMDKFISLSDWIKNNINQLFFVNESVLLKFIIASNIKFKCHDIKYVLRRDDILGVSNVEYNNVYMHQLTLPWVTPCVEKREDKYQLYIKYKNESANNIYFLTNKSYREVHCKIKNIMQNKYIYVTNENSKIKISCSNIASHFIVRLYTSYLISIMINNNEITHGEMMFLSIESNKVVCSNNPNNNKSQFFLLKKDGGYQFLQNDISSTTQIGYGCFLYSDKSNTICTNGTTMTSGSVWQII